MSEPMTIQGELRLPAVFLQGRDMDAIEQQLQAAGLMPVQVRERRWRMDTEAPGGYVLSYTFTLAPTPEEGPWT